MPLPSSTIQANNFNPIVAGQQAQNQQSQFLVNNLSNLGQSISDSISINNMRKEARDAAPIYGQALQQGLGAIQNGDIAGGVQQIYQTNAHFASNPLLAHVGQQAAQGAGMMANGQIRGIQQAAAQGAMNERAQYIQGEANARNQFSESQRNLRAGLTGQGKGSLTANERIKAVEAFNKTADESLADLDSGDPEKVINAYEKYANIKGTLVKAGAYVDMPHYDKVAHEKLDELNKQLDTVVQQINKGDTSEGVMGVGTKGGLGNDLSKIKTQIQQQIARITKANKRAIADGYEFPEQKQGNQAPQGQSASQAPDGTVVTNSQGQKMVKQNGSWQPVQ